MTSSFEIVTYEWFRVHTSYLVDAETAEEAAAMARAGNWSDQDYDKVGTDDLFGHIAEATNLSTNQSIDPDTLGARPDPHFLVNGLNAIVSDTTVIKQLTDTAWIEVKLTTEGVIVDVWQGDACVATSSKMYDELASELAGDDIFNEEN